MQTRVSNGKKVAILATDGFRQDDLFEPKMALEKKGTSVKIVSFKKGTIKAGEKTDWSRIINVDYSLDEAFIEQFDALVIPDGLESINRLCHDAVAINFVKYFSESGKPIAAICHAPSLLIKADVVRGKKLTSGRSIKADLLNAGAHWIDEEIIADQGLVTSSEPTNINVFNTVMIDYFSF